MKPIDEAYAAHAGELYSFAIRSLEDAALAEQAVEETFLCTWREDALDPTDETLRPRLFTTLLGILADLTPKSAESLDQLFLIWQIEEAMRRIDDHHRQILIEVHPRGRNCAEAATALSLPEATVKTHLYEALRALNAALNELAI